MADTGTDAPDTGTTVAPAADDLTSGDHLTMAQAHAEAAKEHAHEAGKHIVAAFPDHPGNDRNPGDAPDTPHNNIPIPIADAQHRPLPDNWQKTAQAMRPK